MKREFTHAELRDLLDYNPETGVFTRRVTRSHNARAGSVTGNRNANGYMRIRIFDRLYWSHRLAFFWMTGAWPAHCVDHINGVRDDNRWGNLREATHAENCRNSRPREKNSSGFKGVTFNKRKGRWHAQITVARRHINIGLFDTPEAAHAAYKSYSQRLHGEFSNTGESHAAQ